MKAPRWAYEWNTDPKKRADLIERIEKIEYLYHGCSVETARKAVTEGLKPRDETGDEGNWEAHPSGSDRIYLSTIYAGYFAQTARGEEPFAGFVRIKADDLDPDFLYPDEDAIEQVTRGQQIIDFGDDAPEPDEMMARVTAHIRDNPDDWQHLYTLSLAALGNCAHMGAIPPDMIDSVRILDIKARPQMAFTFLDPSISVLNHFLMGHKYEALTRWLFGETPSAELFLGFHPEQIGQLGENKTIVRQLEAWSAELANHSGIEVLK